MDLVQQKVKFVSTYKISIWVWDFLLVNLNKSGVDIGSISCPICDMHIDTNDHLITSCIMSSLICRQIRRLWDINCPFCKVTQWLSWVNHSSLNMVQQNRLDVVVLTIFCALYTFRNQLFLGVKKLSKTLFW